MTTLDARLATMAKEMENEGFLDEPEPQTHYHIHNSQVDPDTLPTYETLKEARRAAVEEANVWRYELGAYVKGNANDGYTIQWDKDSMGAWRVYVAPCTEAACMDDLDA